MDKPFYMSKKWQLSVLTLGLIALVGIWAMNTQAAPEVVAYIVAALAGGGGWKISAIAKHDTEIRKND